MVSSKELRVFAEEIRLETVRELAELGFGHIGGSMSIIELLAVLYGSELKHDPKNPGWEERDRLVVSKGHSGPAVYATLALRGYFPLDVLKTLNKNGTNLPSHCDRQKTIGIDMTTGSLGQGASTAAGIALGNKILNRDSYTYLVIGDGELDEGQVWEMAMFAPAKKLSKLIAFVDSNGQQLDGNIPDVLDLGDIAAKFRAFNWHTQQVNGHDIDAVMTAINIAKRETELPSMIVLNTVKGNGCKFAVNSYPNHSLNFKPGDLDESIALIEEGLKQAKEELQGGVK